MQERDEIWFPVIFWGDKPNKFTKKENNKKFGSLTELYLTFN